MLTIHLLGDSLVTAYGIDEENIIGGWGDHLGKFFDENKVRVFDYAQAGRSTRSFLNEGRFIDNGKFGFNDFPYLGPAYNKIQEGDYVLIEFGHNDDDSREKVNLFDRMTPLGQPDENGIYPVNVPIEAMKISNKKVPENYRNLMKESGVSEENISIYMEKGMETLKRYEDMYYSYDCGADYKGYLKFYIDKIRAKKAIPVLVTPTARLRMENGKIVAFPGHHGNKDEYGDFPRIRAVEQIAAEEKVVLIDLFNFSKSIFEMLGYDDATYLQSITDKDGVLIGGVRMGKPGRWSIDYDTRRAAGDFGGIDDTHQNRYGSYVFAGYIAGCLAKSIEDFNNAVLEKSSKKTLCPKHLAKWQVEIERRMYDARV